MFSVGLGFRVSGLGFRVDGDWEGDTDTHTRQDHKTTSGRVVLTGFVLEVNGGPISWMWSSRSARIQSPCLLQKYMPSSQCVGGLRSGRG